MKAREMSPLRQKTVDVMTMKGLSPVTHKKHYLRELAKFDRHTGHQPDVLTDDAQGLDPDADCGWSGAAHDQCRRGGVASVLRHCSRSAGEDRDSALSPGSRPSAPGCRKRMWST